MKNPKAILFFVSLFAVFQFICMFFTPKVEHEVSVAAPFWVIFWILLGTAFFIFLLKKKKLKFTKTWIVISYFIATFFAFSIFFNNILSLLFASAIIILRHALKNKWMHNLGELIAYFGIVQMFTPMFSPITVVLLLLLLSIYDLISVFVTKHMIKLVKGSMQTGYVPAVIFAKTPSMLGGGDFIFPGIYISTMWAYGYNLIAFASAIASVIGLLFLLLIGKKKKAYPALPPITIAMYVSTLLLLLSSLF